MRASPEEPSTEERGALPLLGAAFLRGVAVGREARSGLRRRESGSQERTCDGTT